MRRDHQRYLASAFTIKDVQDSLVPFTGDDKLAVKKWIQDFEEMADLLEWNELQKLIYGKKMLGGSAKRFVAFEPGIKTWDKLKRELVHEFQEEMTSATLHAQLAKRRRQPTESSR